MHLEGLEFKQITIITHPKIIDWFIVYRPEKIISIKTLKHGKPYKNKANIIEQLIKIQSWSLIYSVILNSQHQ